MASIDTSVQLAARAATREELAQRAEKLIAQSRSLNARLSLQLQEREEMGRVEEGECMDTPNPLNQQRQRDTLLQLRTQRFMLIVCCIVLVLLIFGGGVAAMCAGDDSLCML
jgi:lipopolysaccharide export LptBFGC system permease protein LptF